MQAEMRKKTPLERLRCPHASSALSSKVATRGMGCATSRIHTVMTQVCVTSLESSVQTGDIILFSSKHAASHVTKCFTASTWDHCGLVIKLSPKHVFILEYAGGVYLYPLFTRLYSYYAIQGRAIKLRRLKLIGERAQMQQQVEAFVKGVLGQRPPSIEEMVVAVLKQGGALSGFIDTMRGNKEVEDDLSTLFCSKLIAALYKHVGLLSEERTSGDFLPKHFSEMYDGYLDLQDGAQLSSEIPISFDAVQAEVEELKQQIAERDRVRPEAMLSLVSSVYLSALNATRELGAEIRVGGERSLSHLRSGLSGSSERLSCLATRPHGDLPPTRGSKEPDDSPSSKEDEPTGAATLADPAAVPVAADGAAARDEATPSPPMATGGGGETRPVDGGVELRSGKIVDEVNNLDDGGIYSPTASAMRSRGGGGGGGGGAGGGGAGGGMFQRDHGLLGGDMAGANPVGTTAVKLDFGQGGVVASGVIASGA